MSDERVSLYLTHFNWMLLRRIGDNSFTHHNDLAKIELPSLSFGAIVVISATITLVIKKLFHLYLRLAHLEPFCLEHPLIYSCRLQLLKAALYWRTLNIRKMSPASVEVLDSGLLPDLIERRASI